MRGLAKRFSPVVPVLVLLVFVTGCMTSRLHKDDFEGRRIAAVAAFPPNPVIHNDYLAAMGVYPYSPVGRSAFGLAAEEEEQVHRLQGMLESATKRVDLAEHVARVALTTGADRLGATISANPNEADYVLDLRVYHYGLYMRSYRTEANFYLDAELIMRDRATNEVLWRKKLDRIGNYKTRLTGAEMSHLTEASLARELEAFATFAAERMSSALTRTIKNG